MISAVIGLFGDFCFPAAERQGLAAPWFQDAKRRTAPSPAKVCPFIFSGVAFSFVSPSTDPISAYSLHLPDPKSTGDPSLAYH